MTCSSTNSVCGVKVGKFVPGGPLPRPVAEAFSALVPHLPRTSNFPLSIGEPQQQKTDAIIQLQLSQSNAPSRRISPTILTRVLRGSRCPTQIIRRPSCFLPSDLCSQFRPQIECHSRHSVRSTHHVCPTWPRPHNPQDFGFRLPTTS